MKNIHGQDEAKLFVAPRTLAQIFCNNFDTVGNAFFANFATKTLSGSLLIFNRRDPKPVLCKIHAIAPASCSKVERTTRRN